MREYKLVPINDMNVSTTEVCATESIQTPSNNVNHSPKVGGVQDHLISQILNNKELDNHFKLILLKHISQKIDNKMNENVEKNKDDDKTLTNSNLFDIIKNYIPPLDIPNAYRMFTYFVDKNDVQWDDNGNIRINGNKIDLDIYKLFKYLTSRNMKIQDDDRDNLIRLLYSAQPIKKFIKNIHIQKMMDPTSERGGDDGVTSVRPSRIRTRPPSKRKRVMLGDGVWIKW